MTAIFITKEIIALVKYLEIVCILILGYTFLIALKKQKNVGK